MYLVSRTENRFWRCADFFPDAVPEFISQRRRWLNGAFFAAVYSLVHFRQIWTTDHTITRKVLLHIEFVYQLVSLAFTYFSLVRRVASLPW